MYNSSARDVLREYNSDTHLDDDERALVSWMEVRDEHVLEDGRISIVYMREVRDEPEPRLEPHHILATLDVQGKKSVNAKNKEEDKRALRLDDTTISTLLAAWNPAHEDDVNVTGVFVPILEYRHILAIPLAYVSDMKDIAIHAGCTREDGEVPGIELTLKEAGKKYNNKRLFKKAFAVLVGKTVEDYNALLDALAPPPKNDANGTRHSSDEDDSSIATHGGRPGPQTRSGTSPHAKRPTPDASPGSSKRLKPRATPVARNSTETLLTKIYDALLAHVEDERSDRQRVHHRLAQLEQAVEQAMTRSRTPVTHAPVADGLVPLPQTFSDLVRGGAHDALDDIDLSLAKAFDDTGALNVHEVNSK